MQLVSNENNLGGKQLVHKCALVFLYTNRAMLCVLCIDWTIHSFTEIHFKELSCLHQTQAGAVMCVSENKPIRIPRLSASSTAG